MIDTGAVRRRVAAAVSMMLVLGLAAAPRAEAVTVPVGGQFHESAPTRILDTRAGVGAPMASVASGGTVALQVLGVGGVPASGVTAVSLHLTVTGATSGGFITSWPAGSTRPVASSLNFATAQTIANTVMVSPGTGGVVDLYNGSPGSVQLIADLNGYVDDLGGDGRGAFGALSPARLLDTRTGIGAPATALAPGATLDLAVAGHGGVPAVNNGFGYAAAVLNLAAVNPTATGFITAWADDATRPATSNLNLAVGQTIANLAVVPMGSGGGVKIYNGSSQPVELIADVSGYFSAGSPNAQNQFGLVDPTRLLDTRMTTAVAPNSSVAVSLNNVAPLSAGVVNLTVTSPTGSGFLTAWADGSARPNTSSLNFGPGDTIAGLSFVPAGSDGDIDIYNGSGGTVEIIVDEFGYVTGCC